MLSAELLSVALTSAVSRSGSGLAAADALCRVCVDELDVDGAAISLMHDGSSRGTFGSSGELSRRLDEFQFTFGEGPCLDAVEHDRPILVSDLDSEDEQRWPAFTNAALGEGIRAVFAHPVSIAAVPIGAMDLFRRRPGPLTAAQLDGLLLATELAALPLLDLMGASVDWELVGGGAGAWPELASLERVEVYQATGMVMAQLSLNPADALVRIRARAFLHNQTASEVAWAVVERRLSFSDDGTGSHT